ncbi:hypothetical protein EVG20_g61 [Dentipellis fragilis]|uniref:HD domain-containing protein n=1 Tax=Dentipellis fragilis TaxID=205917 RepID=A0A4Y9ZDP2_9AGAM|nr:hypothetical protein EVG20_g61 [Dentipellis fragilis]
MSFPDAVDAYVPRDVIAFFQHANIQPTYIPLSTLRSNSLDATHLASRTYAASITEPSMYAHVERCYLFALAILANGFPSGTPGVPQIPFAELHTRLFHATLLHDLGLTHAPEALAHPAHAMSFELHGGMLAYEHLRRADPNIAPERLGDVVQSIMTHTLALPHGKTTAVGMLLQLSALFDMLGYDAVGPGSFASLISRKTVREVLKVYPRGNQSGQMEAFMGTMLKEKPHCLLGAGIPDFGDRVAAVKELVPDADE